MTHVRWHRLSLYTTFNGINTSIPRAALRSHGTRAWIGLNIHRLRNCENYVERSNSLLFQIQRNLILYIYIYTLGGSNMTGTDFFNHNYQTLTCTCQSSTYSPPESTQFFQRSGSILMPFSKKACGWRRIHSRTVRKPHALQVWFEPSEQAEITWGQIGTVRWMCQKVPFQFP